MNIPLSLTHWQLAQHTAAKIQRALADSEALDAAPPHTPAGDTQTLRGIPAIGRNVKGCTTDQPIPGSDEHLEAMGP